MPSKNARLDRFISRTTATPRREVRQLLAQGRVLVDGQPAASIHQVVGPFSHITLDGITLQAKQPVYLMLNKPAGVVSATQDNIHRTVIDLLQHKKGEPQDTDLHIVGRLDFNSTGLMLLTNDGAWSRALTQPESNIAKHYWVELENPVHDWQPYIDTFAQGMYFAFEDLTTLPAKLEPASPTKVKVILQEGRYHQIKRMFGRFRNKVVGLHRVQVGPIQLDVNLHPGDYRSLTHDEVLANKPV